jgi:hypothetical protein
MGGGADLLIALLHIASQKGNNMKFISTLPYPIFVPCLLHAGLPSTIPNYDWSRTTDSAGNGFLMTNWFESDTYKSSKIKITFKYLHHDPIQIRSKSKYSNIGMSLAISNVEKISNFNPNYFEGPDAPGLTRKLLAITTISKTGITQSYFMPQSGSYVSCEKDSELAFQLEASYAEPATNTAIGKGLDSLLSGGDSFTLSLHSPAGKDKPPLFSITCDAKPLHPLLHTFIHGPKKRASQAPHRSPLRSE